MAMKGHTKIELTNVETGAVRTIEDDNMMTNALGMFVQPSGVLDYNVFSTAYGLNMTNPLLTLTRGLMLFENKIDEDPSIVYPPPGNRMIGQGCNATYTGANTCAGSYNNNESGAIENGYRYVWDFNTSQGNGQISCACLTSQVGGLMGAGNDILSSDWLGNFDSLNPFYVGNYIYYGDMHRTQLQSFNLAGQGAALFLDAENNCYYNFGVVPYTGGWTMDYDMLKNKRLVINKNRLPVTNFSIFDSYKRSQPKLIKQTTYPLPEEFVTKYSTFLSNYASATSYTSNLCHMNEYNKHVYIYIHTQVNYSSPSGSYALSAGAEFMILDLDVEKETLTCFNVTNTTGQAMTLNTNASYCGNPVFVTDKYVFIHVNNGGIYRISRENNADVVRLTKANGEDMSFGSPVTYGNILFYVEIGGKLYACKSSVGKGSTMLCYAIDMDEGIIQPWSANSYSFPGWRRVESRGLNAYYLGAPISKVYGTKYGPLYVAIPQSDNSIAYGEPYIFPHYLFTINNLSNPVVKTSAETMKVTYTIIDAAEY